MINFPNTLTFRLTLRYALAFVTFVAAGFLVLYFALNSILDQHKDEDLEEDVAEFRNFYEANGLERVKSEILREVKTSDKRDVFIRLLDRDGKTLFSSDLTYWQTLTTRENAVQRVLTGSGPVFMTEKVARQEYKTRVVYGLLAPDIVYHAGETTEEKEELLDLLLGVFTVMMVVAIPLASLISWAMARNAVRAIKEISRTAEEIRSGNLDKRVTVNHQVDEIDHLASTFNIMLDRINSLITEMREMADNVAHDMRSPLARIRAISEMALSKDWMLEQHKTAAADVIEECDRLLQMINTSLDVVEAEAGISNETVGEVNMSELVNDAHELFEPVAEQQKISLTCDYTANCISRGHKQNLQRMLANLLNNALKYTPEKGLVSVNLYCTPQKIFIKVKDSGVGIPEKDIGRIFERFYRCDQSRSQDGCGLGLSFARAVARAHGGDISVTSSPGRGSTFVIEMPVKMF